MQLDREELGKLVRDVWVYYCHTIGDDKPSHIAPWESLSEQDKEADRQIGESVAAYVLDREHYRLRCAYCGKFIPFKNAYKVHDYWSGATGSAWKCDSCGEETSEL